MKVLEASYAKSLQPESASTSEIEVSKGLVKGKVDKDNVDSLVAVNAGASIGFSTPAAADHQFVADGDTKGRFLGSRLTYLAASDSKWIVDGVIFGDGTLALPFT